MTCEFFVAGEPQQKGSTRAFAVMRKDKETGRCVPVMSATGTPITTVTTDNPRLKNWENMIRRAASLDYNHEVTAGPVELSILFVMPRPKTIPKERRGQMITKPDGDKLQRAVWDGLTNIVYRDDAQVVAWSGRKRYAEPGERTGVHITVTIEDSLFQ